MNEWKNEYKNQRQTGRHLWVSGMLEKQGKLKRRLLCPPSLLVQGRQAWTVQMEVQGGTGRHWTTSKWLQLIIPCQAALYAMVQAGG